MKSLEPSLLTPIYAKTTPGEDWPKDQKVFYLLSGDGLFLCRNHEFFRSSVPAPVWPSELEGQRTFLRIDYPKVPRRILEQIVGFFDTAWQLHGGEAAALLAWHRERERVYVIVPHQVATVTRSFRGDVLPSGVHYETPSLPPCLTIFCDIHSHCDLGAYTSAIDADDETYRPGLHAVVGRLQDEPPQFHTNAVVDSVRFQVKQHVLFGSYRNRKTDFPRSWLRKIRVEEQSSFVRKSQDVSGSSPQQPPEGGYTGSSWYSAGGNTP